MQTIHKQSLTIETIQAILIPVGAKFLSVALQKENLCIWYECNPAMEKITRIIHMYGTGHEVSNKQLRFIGTVQLYNGDLVFHIFEELL